MNINLYKLTKKPESTKRPVGDGLSLACTLLDECSIISPILKIKAPASLDNAERLMRAVRDTETYYEIDTILDAGMVSDGTNRVYVTSNFNDVSNYSNIYISFNYNGVDQTQGLIIDTSSIGSGVSLTVLFEPANLYFSFYLTKTSIRGTSYAGSWVDITATITALTEHEVPPTPPTPPTPTGSHIYDYNYAYIPEFSRYYFIKNVVWNNGTWLFYLEVDDMATKKGEIGASEHYIERCSYEFDGDIIDSMYPTKTNIGYRVATTANDNATIFGQAPSPSFIVGFIGGVAEENLSKVDQCYNGSVVYFCLTQDQLYDLVFMLLGAVDLYHIPTSEMSFELQKQLINPMQYIHSIKCVPFNPNVDGDSVAVAVYCGFQYLQIPNGSWKILTAPTIGQASSDNGYLEKRSVNFRIPVHPDYVDRGHFVCGTPYSKYIFEVNAFGQIEIPSSAVLAAEVKFDANTEEYYLNLVITTIFDISTGDCTLFLQFRDPPAQVSDVKPAEAFISITKNLAIDVPVHQSIQDAMTFRQKDRELKFQTIGAVTTLLKAAPEAIAKTAAFGFTSDQMGLVDTAVDITAKMMKTIDDATIANQVQISGTGNNGSYMSYNRDLLRPRVHCYFAPFAEENNAERGKPLCAVRKISDIPGYILCSGAEFESDLTATENETISRYLNGGFFYE